MDTERGGGYRGAGIPGGVDIGNRGTMGWISGAGVLRRQMLLMSNIHSFILLL